MKIRVIRGHLSTVGWAAFWSLVCGGKYWQMHTDEVGTAYAIAGAVFLFFIRSDLKDLWRLIRWRPSEQAGITDASSLRR